MNPDDPASFRHCIVNDLNDIRIHYIDENSSSPKVLLLLHGFPDLWFGKYMKVNDEMRKRNGH
jgi:soluble epoxide hydrolase/lipid-phosphate phosphatase